MAAVVPRQVWKSLEKSVERAEMGEKLMDGLLV